MNNLKGQFSHLDSHGNAVDLYLRDERLLVGTACAADGAAPAALTELSYDAIVEFHHVLGGFL